jgi:hypothetical protein
VPEFGVFVGGGGGSALKFWIESFDREVPFVFSFISEDTRRQVCSLY